MRHRKKGRVLGRSPSHRKAMLRNMASSLILTEGDWEDEDNEPRVKGRIVATIHKAKEVRGLVERCVTIAKRSIPHQEQADSLNSDASVGSAEWQEWNQAIAPVVAARRRAARLLGNKQAVRILFEEIAPRFADRDGGYTRVLRLAQPRLGDNGTQAILEFVGVRDRISERAPAPSFEDESPEEEAVDQDVEEETVDESAEVSETEAAEEAATEEPEDVASEEGADEEKDAK
ncbi:MAG: 50S ribosomal protein L17 [Pirellulales bacterium]|nr:50S ribosomal protein L17 [Pirellulales bacterium]